MEGGEREEKRRVVVIGGGVAGALLAKNVQFNSDLVLIDPKEYFEIPWADLRAMVEPPFAEKILIKHTDYLTNAAIVTSRAIGVTETEVLTDGGRSVPYDFLVIATGHADPVARSRNDRIEQFREENEKIKSSSSILIIGGGPTGVELAGEIATDYPGKKVTLVHKGSRLLEYIGPKASVKALKWLKEKNVEVLFQQTVDLESISDGQKEFKTSAGKSVTADCHFVCIGRPLASSWLKETILGKSLDEHGRLMVDEKLRVNGQKNIFAIGDITNIKELKQGYLAQAHATLVAKNLKLIMKGVKETNLAAYKAGSAIAIVSLGRKSAVAQFPFATISGRVPGMIKSKDLFAARTRKTMGVDP
ncbi:apoptosis-inducing factor homolog B-like [Ananas comosus]|uniref:Apoptosis-inducing factor homolog B-like n=1 Tax=Ananas comosus TaxID=4615 RepID=A0A6P5GAX8_ANACO|nr:apoptosis-inducing factor homolog B-like [Ananas comosus]